MKQLLFLALCALTAAAQQPKGPMTDQRVVNLAYAGLSADELVRVIRNAPEVNFDLTPAALDGLAKAGISDQVIRAMAARESGATVSTSHTDRALLIVSHPHVQPVAMSVQSAPGFPEQELLKGIAYGKQFEDRKDFLRRGLGQNKIQLSSAWSKDGISKYVTFYQDYDVVAAAVVLAHEQLRELSTQDLSQLPYSGLLFANLDLRARGLFPIKHLNDRFAGGGTHMVLEIDGTMIQPAKEGFFPAPEHQTCYGQYYSFSAFTIHNFTFGAGGWNDVSWDCTPQRDRFSIEFGFRLTAEQKSKKARVIIVNSEGHKYAANVDLANLR